MTPPVRFMYIPEFNHRFRINIKIKSKNGYSNVKWLTMNNNAIIHNLNYQYLIITCIPHITYQILYLAIKIYSGFLLSLPKKEYNVGIYNTGIIYNYYPDQCF